MQSSITKKQTKTKYIEGPVNVKDGAFFSHGVPRV